MTKQRIYQNTQTRIETIANEQTQIESAIKVAKEKGQSGWWTYQQLGALLNVYVQGKILEYKDLDLLIKVRQEPAEVFFLPAVAVGDLHHVLDNIIQNAVEAMVDAVDPVLQCELRVVDDRNYCEIAVIDTGCGMSKRQVNTILVDSQAANKSQEYNEGLQYVLSKVDSWGGSCDVSSKKSCGTHFSIKLPLKLEATINPASE